MAENATNGETKPENNKKEDLTNGDEAATPTVKEQRAIVLTGFGGIKSVKVLKKPEPQPAEGEVLIRVKTGGLSFADLMLRQGVLDNAPKAPFIMGFECAGEVEAVGEGVTDVKVGDRVAALAESRAWAELVNVPAKYVYKIPSSMSFQDASAITLNAVVAYALLFDVGNLRPGQTVLIHSIGGGVGHALTQLARTVDNVTVIGTASKHKFDALKDNVNHLFDHSNDYVSEVKKISPEGVDLVLDCLCGDDANKGYNLLKPMGRYVLYGTSCIVAGETKSFFSFAKSWWQVDKISPMKLFDENKSLSGFHLRHLLYQQGKHEYVRSIVDKVYKLYQSGKIKPVVDSTWAFEDIADAMQKLHERKNIGKVILDPAQEPKPRPVEEVVEKKRKGSSKSKSIDEGKKEEKGKEKEQEKNAENAEKPAEDGDAAK